MGLPATRSARRTRRRIPCSSGDAWRRSTIRRGTSFSAVRPIRRRRWSSARRGAARRRCGSRPTAELEAYNQANPGERVFVISYDDFNPYLDNCRAAMRARDMDAGPGRAGGSQDHMDAILSLGVTQLVDLLTTEKVDLTVLSLDQRRDLLLLAALYDASTGEPIARRWSRLRRRSGFRPLWTRRDLQIGFGTTLAGRRPDRHVPVAHEAGASCPGCWCRSLAGWLYWGWRLARAEWFARDIRKGLRVLSRDPVGPALGAALVQADRAGRPAAAHGDPPAAPRSATSCCASSRASCTRWATPASSS